LLTHLRNHLASLKSADGDPPPNVDFRLYFEGNDEEDCIAPNQWLEGRPSIADMYQRLLEIARRPMVERVLVGLHDDWRHPSYDASYPPAENVHIYSRASKPAIEAWLHGWQFDVVRTGWPYGKHPATPDPSPGDPVHTVCWDQSRRASPDMRPDLSLQPIPGDSPLRSDFRRARLVHAPRSTL